MSHDDVTIDKNGGDNIPSHHERVEVEGVWQIVLVVFLVKFYYYYFFKWAASKLYIFHHFIVHTSHTIFIWEIGDIYVTERLSCFGIEDCFALNCTLKFTYSSQERNAQ